MIRRILEAQERAAGRTTIEGVDLEGRRVWSSSGHDVLAATGAWQAELAERGVGPGDRVGLEVGRGPQLLPAHLAVLASGATVVPINPALAASERTRVIERGDLRALVTDTDSRRSAARLRLEPSDPTRPALLIFTSGTTGDPKGVPLTEANLEANLADLATLWALGPTDRLLHALPCHHLHGLVLALYGAARLGLRILLMERFDAVRCLAELERGSATVFMGVPTMLRRLARLPEARPIPTMRLFVSGSAPLSPRDFQDFSDRFEQEPLERYGLTETMIVTSNPLDGERRPGQVGPPLPHAQLRLAEDGEIEVRGPAVMSGYWREPELSTAAFRDGYFRTGDLGRIDTDGTLRIDGRKRELIIVGGSNVIPAEVERLLADDAGVEEIATTGLPDPDRGEVVAAFVVVRPGHAVEQVEARLRARAEEGLAAYKRPRVYRFLADLPRNAMGKIDRRALKG